MGVFNGGFFENRELLLRKDFEQRPSLRPVCEDETNYTNASGYWMVFHKSAIDLRQEALADKNEAEASLFDVWALSTIRYGLLVTGMRCEFYKIAAKDPT